MKRRLFTMLSVLSLLLFVAVMVMWVRSYALGYEALVWSSPRQRLSIQISNGRCWVWREADLSGADVFDGERPFQHYVRMAPLPFHSYRRVQPEPSGDWRGFDAGFGSIPELGIHWREAVIPFWFVLLASTLLPARWFLLYRRSRDAAKRRKNLCPACGYDLRATPDRCPECRAAPTKEGK